MKSNLYYLVCALVLVALTSFATAPVAKARDTAANLQEGFVQEIDLGKARLLSIVDSPTTFEASLLTPKYREALPGGRFSGVVKTWLLLVDNRKILFDAGWGTHRGHHGTTVRILKEHGIAPEEITDIVMTHLDNDHVGGLAHDGKAAFAKATLHVSDLEYTAWMKDLTNRSKEAAAFTKSMVRPYPVRTFAYDTEILPGIWARDAHGHTPGHTIYDLDFGGRKMAILGDIMHIAAVQLRFPGASTSYDMDVTAAAQSRLATFRRLARNKTLMGGMHFPQTGYIREHVNGSFGIEEAR